MQKLPGGNPKWLNIPNRNFSINSLRNRGWILDPPPIFCEDLKMYISEKFIKETLENFSGQVHSYEVGPGMQATNTPPEPREEPDEGLDKDKSSKKKQKQSGENQYPGRYDTDFLVPYNKMGSGDQAVSLG